MKHTSIFLMFGTLVTVVVAQRPWYAGSKPIGYPELGAQFGTEEPPSSTAALENRFGEDGQPITTTTMRLPVDALGDRELINRIQTWPRDKWPFWYINYLAIEEHRNQRPGNTQTGQGTSSGQTQAGQTLSTTVVPSRLDQSVSSTQRLEQNVPASGTVQASRPGQRPRQTWDQQNWNQQNWDQQRWRQENWQRQNSA